MPRSGVTRPLCREMGCTCQRQVSSPSERCLTSDAGTTCNRASQWKMTVSASMTGATLEWATNAVADQCAFKCTDNSRRCLRPTMEVVGEVWLRGHATATICFSRRPIYLSRPDPARVVANSARPPLSDLESTTDHERLRDR
jgi:hypothetical protein